MTPAGTILLGSPGGHHARGTTHGAEVTCILTYCPMTCQIYDMGEHQLTEQEMDILGEDIAEKVTGELAAHVIWSFKVRPMVALTEKEAERRLDIAWEVWKALTHEHGYEATQAVRAVPEMLIAHLDKCPSEGMEGLITPVFDTKLVPIDGRANVSPERALSALAAKSGRVEPRGIALTGIDRKE